MCLMIWNDIDKTIGQIKLREKSIGELGGKYFPNNLEILEFHFFRKTYNTNAARKISKIEKSITVSLKNYESE